MVKAERVVLKGLATVAVVLLMLRCAVGAEIRLRAECEPAGALVTLGDVAEVLAADAGEAADLRAVELFPTPAPGGKRFVRAREIQDLLFLRGVNLVEHRFSGSSQVAVLGREAEAPVPEAPAPGLAEVKSTEEAVEEAVALYLQQYVSADEPWNVDVSLDESRVRRIAAAEGLVSVRGGESPWVGVQAFELTLRTGSGVEQLAVDARVTLPPPVVVAARSLARGTVIAPGDVRLQRPAATGGSPVQQSIGYRRATSGKADDAFHSLEDVLGMEAARSISAGSALEPKMVRRPVLVERGELVTVVARSGGIRVRTTARAKEDASLGDLVAVESLESRKEYFARVCGPQEVEVYARPSGAERIAAAEGW